MPSAALIKRRHSTPKNVRGGIATWGCCWLVPYRRMLDLVIGLIPSACAFHGQADVSSSDLAGVAELKVAKLFPWRDERRPAQGIAAHAQMFRRS
jgi:hypothetical protein